MPSIQEIHHSPVEGEDFNIQDDDSYLETSKPKLIHKYKPSEKCFVCKRNSIECLECKHTFKNCSAYIQQCTECSEFKDKVEECLACKSQIRRCSVCRHEIRKVCYHCVNHTCLRLLAIRIFLSRRFNLFCRHVSVPCSA